MHGFALTYLIFRAESFIFFGLHSLDGNADARDLVHAAPYRVAAAFANLTLDLVLVELVREALRSMNRCDNLFTSLLILCINCAAFVLREHELDRVPVDLLRSSWR